MKVKMEMNIRNICFIVIIVICILALAYGVYYQVFIKPTIGIEEKPIPVPDDVKFDELFDNKVNLQDYDTSANFVNKIEPTKDLVYTTYNLNEIYEGKYEIQASIPLININNENAINIDREILDVFYGKINNILDRSSAEVTDKTIYTVSYTAYLNENILSLIIKATLKEGANSQRVIIKSYTYNISTNQEVKLKEMLDIKGASIDNVQNAIKKTIEDAINYSESLSSLGHESFKRNPKNDMYNVENSDNYFLGPNQSIYIIYAYGNTNFTSEKDIVYIK